MLHHAGTWLTSPLIWAHVLLVFGPFAALVVKMMRDDPAKRRYLPSFLRPTKENLC